MSFTRRKEDFVCEKCGAEVRGTGYTNHCPRCLWSKHVDGAPGDRAERCGGMMMPAHLEGSTPRYRIIHRCERCHIERAVNTQANDDQARIVALSEQRASL